MLKSLLGERVNNAVCASASGAQLYEVRFRVGKPIYVITARGCRTVYENGSELVCSREMIARVLEEASGHSVYAVEEELVKGFLHYEGGIRIGACGEGVLLHGNMVALKHIGYLSVRLPREVKGCADAVLAKMGEQPRNTLVVSPPSGGKTTMLRELARVCSKRTNTLIIDERFEIAGSVDGVSSLDVGNSDVVSGVPKMIAYQNAVRAMNPSLLVTDEVFGKDEVDAIIDSVRCGITVFASLHGDGENGLKAEVYSSLRRVFSMIVSLSAIPKPGTLLDIVTLK